jgi:hypothetical protein
MRAFLVGIGVIALLACGGNVVVDGSPPDASGAGGAGTGGDSCAALESAFQVALQAAIACDPSEPPSICMEVGTGECGCPILVNSSGDLAANELAAYHAMQDAGCVAATGCPGGCPAVGVMFAQCLPVSGGYQCGEGPG